MTRKEYNDYRYIKSYKTKGYNLSYGTQLRIPVNASPDYKLRLHKLYSEWNFHPCTIGPIQYFPEMGTMITYIYGRTWEDENGIEQSWTSLYTEDERKAFDAALR